MTGQLIHVFMKCQRYIAVGTLWNPTTVSALHHWGKASSILKENHLQVVLQSIFYRANERWRKRSGHHLAMLKVFRIDDLDFG